MSTRTHRPGVHDLARLLIALEDDERLALATRRTRDEALRAALPEQLSGWDRLHAWLEHVDADGRRLAAEVASTLRGVTTLVVLTGALAGWLAVLGAFYYDGSGRVNVPAVLGVLGLLPLLMLGLSWLGALGAGGGFASALGGLASGARRLSAGRLAGLFARLYRGDGRRGVECLLGHGDTRVATLRRWLLFGWSHQCALGFFAAVLITALALVVFTDLAFGWSTTLDVSPATVHRIVALLAMPWSWLLPGAVPDLALVHETRYFRLSGTSVRDITALAELGRWWGFLLTALLVYGLLPRLLSLLLARLFLRRALRLALTDNAAARALLERLSPPTVHGAAQAEALADARGDPRTDVRADVSADAGADAAAGSGASGRAADPAAAAAGARASMASTASAAPAAAPGAAPSAHGGPVVNWSAVPLGEESLRRLLGAKHIEHAGSGMDLEAEAALVEHLDAGAGVVTLVCKAWEPPLLDLLDFIEAIVTRHKVRVQVLPLRVQDGGAAAPEARDREVWQRAMARAPVELLELDGAPHRVDAPREPA